MTRDFRALPQPPAAKKVPHERIFHGDTFIDDYEWMRNREDPELVAHLEAENAHTLAMTTHLADLRGRIFHEIKARTQETDLSVPSRSAGYWYYSRTQQGLQYPVICRTAARDEADWTPPLLKPGEEVPGEQVLVDCNVLAEGSEFFSLGTLSVTLDDHLLAYSTDVVGDERYTIYLKDLRTCELLPDRIAGTLGSAIWSTTDTHIFYSTVDEAWRADKIWRHELGTPKDRDVLVYEETDARFATSVGRTTSDRYLLISSGSKITSEIRLLEADDPAGEFRVVITRVEGVEYDVDHGVVGGVDRLFVLHNLGAENFTLGVGPVDVDSLDQLETVIAPSETVRLNDIAVAETALVVNLREGALPQVRVFSLVGGQIGAGANVHFDEELLSANATGFSDWKQPLVRLVYSSWVTPRTVYEYDPVTGQLHLRKQQAVLGGYDAADYVQTREWVVAADGARIPISIVHRRNVVPRSGSPLLIYGYGAYEISYDPAMSIPRLSLLDRGMVYVLAHIRGGGEMGRSWYDNGKLLKKKNTFTDFVDCANHLIDTGWTTPGQLVALGGSAGGLLVGAVANLAPDTFAGIVAEVPFVDALTTILDPSMPLTVTEWDEWGDPLHDPKVYGYMKSYTPYENVERKDYPAVFALTSINDTRVHYVEPAKWIAKLRETVTGESPILLKCEMSAGHGGASGRYDSWREMAEYYAWIIDISGAAHDAPGPLAAPDNVR